MELRFESKFRLCALGLLGLVSVVAVEVARLQSTNGQDPILDPSPSAEVDAAAEVEQINAQGYQPFVIGTKPDSK